MIIGIDNGLKGGIVALSPIAGLAPIAKFPLPTRGITYPARKTTKARTANEIDTRAFVSLLNQIGGKREEITVYFEDCPFHADQAKTMRSMAISAGKIVAVLEAMAFPKIRRILSYDWHPEILGKVPQGQTKAYALAAATGLWPEETWLASAASSTPHDGMIDAALIAEYGRRITYPQLPKPNTRPDELPWD